MEFRWRKGTEPGEPDEVLELIHNDPFLAQLRAEEEAAKAEAKSRGWLTGDINQTDAWFRS